MTQIIFSALATPILFIVFFDMCCRIDLEERRPIQNGINIISSILLLCALWAVSIAIAWAVRPHA